MSCGGAFLRMVTPLRGSMMGARRSLRSCGAASAVVMEEMRAKRMTNLEVIEDMIAFAERLNGVGGEKVWREAMELKQR
jgi:ABC-type taurine transport system ATPase subunit